MLLFDLGQRSLKILKLKLVFLIHSWVILNQISCNSLLENGIEICTNELGNMAEMTAMPIMIKTFKILLQIQLTNDQALCTRALPRLFK